MFARGAYGDDAQFDAGQIGQWQNGVIEVIDPGDKRTAAPVYPKPPWPGQ